MSNIDPHIPLHILLNKRREWIHLKTHEINTKYLSNSKNNLHPFVRQNATPHDEQPKMSLWWKGMIDISRYSPEVTVNSVIRGDSPLRKADLMPHGIKASIKFRNSFVRLWSFWSFFSLLLFPIDVFLEKFLGLNQLREYVAVNIEVPIHTSFIDV